MAIGLDTSVVVPLLVGLPEAQALAARHRLERAAIENEPVFVADLVVAEAYFALQHHYRVPKGQARALLSRFLNAGVVQLDPGGALPALAISAGAGLVDRLIHARYTSLGAVTVTFERQQSRLEGAVRLRSVG